MEESTRSIANINLSLPKGKQANISIVNQEPKPYYYMVGNGNRNNFLGKGHSPMNAIDELTSMTPQELWVIKLMNANLRPLEYGDKMITTSKVFINTSEFSNSEKQKFTKGYQRLRSKDIIRREKRQHYMFNPNFFIPKLYDLELEFYLTLT